VCEAPVIKIIIAFVLTNGFKVTVTK